MSGSLNLTITTSVGNTQQAFAQVAASIQQLNANLAAAGQSARSFSTSITQAANGNTQVSVTARTAAQGMNQLAHGSSGVVRELLVMGHEAMSGRFSRIPGSLMVMTERMGGLSLATMGLVGAFAAAALGAAHLVEWMERIKSAKEEGETSAAYFNPQINDEALDKIIDKTRQLPGVSTEVAGKMAQIYAGMRGTTVPQIQAMIDVTQTYASATGKSLDAAAQSIRAVMEAPSSKGREFISQFADSAQTLAAFDKITGDTAPMQRRLIIMQELADANERARETKNATPAPGAGNFDFSEMLAGMAGPQAAAEQKQQATNAAMLQRQKDFQAAMANMSNEETATGATAQTWFEKQQLGADQLKDKIIGTATNYKTAMQQADAALADYWKEVSAHAVQGSKEQIQAQEEYLRYKDASEMASMRVTAQNADAGFKAQEAALSAQIAAAGNNKDQVLALEQQKVDLYIQYNKQGTAAYEEELRRQAELVNRYKAQESEAEMNAVEQQVQADSRAYSNKQMILNAEVKAHQLTKAQEIADETAANESMQQQELAAIDQYISTLTLGTSAFQKAMDERARILENFNARQAALSAQQIGNDQKAATGTEKVYDTMFNSIGSQGENTFAKLIDGQESFQRAGIQMADAVVSSFVKMCVQMIARWVAMELAKTATTTTQNAVRTAQDAGGSGLTVLIGKTLAQWLGLETSKTAISTAGNATRTGASLAADTTQTASTALNQAAQVGATVAGQTAKTAATITGAATSRAAVSAIQGPGIIADAAKAFSGTYASVASIPLIGWLLAPPAATAAFAAVAAYEGLASFDTGAYNLPGDMVAQVHKGEMIIPAKQAEQMRGSMDSGFNIASFAPNVTSGKAPADMFSSSNNQGGNISFVQNLAVHGAPGAVGGMASSLMTRGRKEAESMMWNLGRNGALKPRNV